MHGSRTGSTRDSKHALAMLSLAEENACGDKRSLTFA